MVELAEIDIASGDTSTAAKRLDEAEKGTQGAPQLLARVLLSQTRVGNDRLDEAEKLIRDSHHLQLEWQLHYYRALKAGDPGADYRAMLDSILAARLRVKSVAARMGALEDKTEALQSYLTWLLADPTPERVEEARSVIRKVRSVTLLDELISAAPISPEIAQQLEQVRRDLQDQFLDVELGDDLGGNSRRLRGRDADLVMTRARATNALLSLELSDSVGEETGKETLICAETRDTLHFLGQGVDYRVDLNATALSNELRWLYFDLFSPVVESRSEVGGLRTRLDRLADLFEPVLRSSFRWLCLDGNTWRIPWGVLRAHLGISDEISLAIHPSMTSLLQSPITRSSKVAVWLGEHPNIPYTSEEASRISALFDDCTILRSSSEVRQSLNEEFDLVHVVSHAVHRTQNPMLSALIFPDGPLYAFEITRSGLRTKLATLSACDTGTFSLSTRTEPDGFVRSFVARGAESVIASQWQLDDESAYRQFGAFFDGVLRGNGVLPSLQSARDLTREWRDHPYYWGALALYSGYQNEKSRANPVVDDRIGDLSFCG
jgi:hypothetical protein